ncbi:MAG TPA: hypothetical protein VNX68_14220, partial [Nitrosopumilaceae archaeon]|nr:hypothetical protein [Nitrosopumilaceae archaeon]
YESLHIVFWLAKDSCWMLELKLAGVIMIIPTLSLALYIVYKTIHVRDFYLNMAVFFWILANSFWMVMEFFYNNQYKSFAAIPFSLGFVFVGLFYIMNHKKKEINPYD